MHICRVVVSGLTGGSRPSSPHRPASPARPSTSRYNSLQSCTLEDLQCPICLGDLRDAVAAVPCGHTFCAACLSQHLESQLTEGQTITCPVR